MNPRDEKALSEIARLCDVGSRLVDRGYEWFAFDVDNVPGLAAESLIIKVGENVARLSPETLAEHPDVPWSLIKQMRDRLAHHYEATDYDLVWQTLLGDFPAVREYVRSI